VVEADEMDQNAGEKRGRARRPAAPACPQPQGLWHRWHGPTADCRRGRSPGRRPIGWRTRGTRERSRARAGLIGQAVRW